MKNILLGLGRKAVLFSAVSFMLLAFTGCDKLNLLIPKKEEPKQVVAPVVAVKGTIIAKVNNTPITLEELNKKLRLITLWFRQRSRN